MPEFDLMLIGLLLLLGTALLLNFVFNQKYDRGEILEVLDGDSIVVSTKKYRNGIKVRLAGIDAPEKSSSVFHKDEKYARQSTRYVEQRLKPRTNIYLEYDKKKWDQYGRLLAYVYITKTGQSINTELVKKGYAFFKPDKYNKKHEKELKELEARARKGKYGLWEYYS